MLSFQGCVVESVYIRYRTSLKCKSHKCHSLYRPFTKLPVATVQAAYSAISGFYFGSTGGKNWGATSLKDLLNIAGRPSAVQYVCRFMWVALQSSAKNWLIVILVICVNTCKCWCAYRITYEEFASSVERAYLKAQTTLSMCDYIIHWNKQIQTIMMWDIFFTSRFTYYLLIWLLHEQVAAMFETCPLWRFGNHIPFK